MLNRCLCVFSTIFLFTATEITKAFAAGPSQVFCIEVIDESNLWPVPLVEVKTTSELRFVSDNAGIIAVDAPELFHHEVWFGILSDGYEVPADGFGFRGIRVTPRPGENIQVKLKRTSLAKRIGRITGNGLLAESHKVGRTIELGEQDSTKRDIQDSLIVGCDSVHVTKWKDRYFWLWGDTSVRNYPLGIFDTLGATTDSKAFLHTQPPVTPSFRYFTDRMNKPRGIAPIDGEGPTWLMGLAVVRDKDQSDRLVASYSKVKNHLEIYEWGLCVWDEKTSRFVRHKKIWTRNKGVHFDPSTTSISSTSQRQAPPSLPNGHAVRRTDDNQKEWILFGDPFPFMECEATFEAWEDPSQWKPVTKAEYAETFEHPPRKIYPHRGEIAYHSPSNKWIAIFTEQNGRPSPFGEIWYAESLSAKGPWINAVKVLSHQNYSFYNPVIHLLEGNDSQALLFEGTYTAEFANKPEKTPRYNYNQMLYRVDLNELPSNKIVPK